MDNLDVERAAIGDLLNGLTEAWNRADADAWAGAYSNDAVFINIIGLVSEGPDAIRAQHAGIWSSIYKGSELAQAIRAVRFLGPDVAIADIDIRLSGIRELPPGAASNAADDRDGRKSLRTIMRHVLQKSDGAWRITASQNTVVTPLPPPH